VNTANSYTYALTGVTESSVTGCSNIVSGTASVTVNSLPTKPTLTSQAICEGTTATITGPSGTYTYTWQVPTGVATSTTKTVTTNKAGTYSLTITDVNSCTSEVGTATVTVNPLPAKPTLTSQVICEGATATITGPTGTYTYTWQVPTGVATSTTKTVSTNKVGTYSLTITDENSCTSEVGTATVTVNALPPKPTLTSPVICEGAIATVTMSAPTGTNTYTYNWRVPTGVATSTSNSLTTTKAGSYSLTITDANICTSEVGTGIVTVNPIPTFTISSPSVCLGATLTISANPLSGAKSDYNYTWQVPNGASIPGNVSSFSATTAGVYTATIKNKITNCESATLNNNAVFHPLPSAKTIVASDNKVIVNKTLNLTAAATGGTSPYTFTWTPSSTMNYSISGQENAVFSAIKEGKVNIKYQVKDVNNCEANSDEYEITINKAVINGNFKPYNLPDAFTPNGDGKNDVFKIIVNDPSRVTLISFQIYNRNGILMFSTNRISEGWNGRYKDVMQDMGVYFVKLITLENGLDTPSLYLFK
jgi:gliding motility-associated-like protein